MTVTPIAPELEQWIDHPSGWLALSPRNARFERPGAPGFVAYREQGKHLVVFGGVHAPEAERAPLLAAFLAHADERRKRVLAVQVRAAQAALFAAHGFTVNRFGASYGLSIASHGLGGGARVKLRQKVKRAEKLGLKVLELGVDLPRDGAAFAKLEEISAVWLKKKGKHELDFMIGELGEPDARRRRVFVVVEPATSATPATADEPARLAAPERWSAFISYVPAPGVRAGWLHDLTRRLPDARPGAMELCNHAAIERFRTEGAAWLHFGFTPFLLPPASADPELPQASRLAAWIIGKLGRWGGAIYPAEDQVRYKQKWAPDVVEAEYLAFRPLSLRAIWDLLVVTRSV